MAGDIISKKTRQEFREHFVGWTLRTIEMEFDAADITCASDFAPGTSGERRTLVEQYYHSVDFSDWKHVRKILKVFEGVLAKLDEDVLNPIGWVNAEAPKREREKLLRLLERDGFQYENGHIIHQGQVARLPMVQEAAATLDVPELHRQLLRLRDAHEDDPALAIGTAKELIETTCKTILHERKVTFNEGADISELVKETRKALDLLPDNVPNAAKGAEAIKRVLSNLGAVAQGLAELRNLYGTGHGKAGATRGLSARHARLAVGSAATLATFLLETHEARGGSRSNNDSNTGT